MSHGVSLFACDCKSDLLPTMASAHCVPATWSSSTHLATRLESRSIHRVGASVRFFHGSLKERLAEFESVQGKRKFRMLTWARKYAKTGSCHIAITGAEQVHNTFNQFKQMGVSWPKGNRVAPCFLWGWRSNLKKDTPDWPLACLKLSASVMSYTSRAPGRRTRSSQE